MAATLPLAKSPGTPLSSLAAEVAFDGASVRCVAIRIVKAWGDRGYHDVGLGHVQFVEAE